MTKEEKERIDRLMKNHEIIDKANREGFAGILPNGNLVDRRNTPQAHPIAKNSMFNVAQPRCIKCQKETDTDCLVKSLCEDCRKSTKTPSK